MYKKNLETGQLIKIGDPTKSEIQEQVTALQIEAESYDNAGNGLQAMASEEFAKRDVALAKINELTNQLKDQL
jgi:hypothetical protein